MKRWMKLIGGIVLLAVGLLWGAQGLNLVPGTPMSGQTVFLVLGIVLVLIGAWPLASLRTGSAKVHVGLTKPRDGFLPIAGTPYVYGRCRACRDRRAVERYHSRQDIRQAEIARS